jgi:integrase
MRETNKKAGYGLGLAVNMVRGIRKGVNAAFNFAVDQDLILKNPVRKTVVPPQPLSAVNPFTIEEAWAFVSVKDLFWYGDAFSFQLQTGLRPEELIALIEDDIDFDKGELRIERACKWVRASFTGFGTLKSRRSYRVIKLAPEHLEFLKAHLEKQKRHIRERTNAGLAYGEPKLDEWIRQERSKQRHKYTRTNLLFPSQAGKVPCINVIRVSFKSMLRRAGFTGSRLKVRMYDLRHTHATILLTLGFPDHEVAARMGHTVDELNNTYAHEYKGMQRRASSMFLSLIPLNTFGSAPPSGIQHSVTNLMDKLNKDLEEGLKNLLISGAPTGA